jgi:DNA-binding HxlR family transcriptional regulator
MSNHPRRADQFELVANVIGDRWTLLVLREAYFGVRRYGEMARNLGISRKVLASRLKGLVAAGLLEKRRYRTDPDWYEYVLTPAGIDLYAVAAVLLHWAAVYMPALGEPVTLHHRPCGHDTHARVVCAVCGEDLDPRDVDVGMEASPAEAA